MRGIAHCERQVSLLNFRLNYACVIMRTHFTAVLSTNEISYEVTFVEKIQTLQNCLQAFE